MRDPLIIAWMLCACLCATAPGQRPAGDGEGSKMSGKLGRETNPIRCDGPAGQKEYLERLRDLAGNRITYQRAGTHPAGPYGHAMDSFRVIYRDGYSLELFMDMYHPGYVEKSAPADFQIVPPESPAPPAGRGAEKVSSPGKEPAPSMRAEGR